MGIIVFISLRFTSSAESQDLDTQAFVSARLNPLKSLLRLYISGDKKKCQAAALLDALWMDYLSLEVKYKMTLRAD